MTTFPDIARVRLLGTQTQARMARHDIICLHTMVGNLTSTFNMFKQGGFTGVESHFGIGGIWGPDDDAGLNGVAWQFQDTDFRADANLEGNDRIISIETADNAPQAAADIRPWTPAQQDRIVRLVAALCQRYDIPAVLVPDSRSDRRGIAYHRQGCQHSGGTHPAGFLQPGCEKWSTAVGKECPGPARIAQIPGIITRVRAVLAGPEKEGTDMAFEPKDVWNGKGTDMIPHNDPVTREPTDPDNPTWFPLSTLEETNRVVRGLKTQMSSQQKSIDDLSKAVGELVARLPQPGK